MAKRKKTKKVEPVPVKQEPKLTRAAFLICLSVIVLGLLAQLVMAIIVYPQLPGQIPSGWVGSSMPHNTVPSWLVFLAFPAAQLVLMALSLCSPKDEQGKHVMDSGQALTLVLLAVAFTALQASAFHIPYYGR